MPVQPRVREPMPLRGFGWPGWLLLPVAAVLGWVYVSGYDLRFTLMEWLCNAAGIGAAWHIGVATALLTWAIRDRMRPAPAWACQACGYDLRGSQGGWCPECGVSGPTGMAVERKNGITSAPSLDDPGVGRRRTLGP